MRRGGGTKGTDYQNREFVPQKKEQAHGMWWRSGELWKCSVCQLEQVQPFPECPMCGAVMDRWSD